MYLDVVKTDKSWIKIDCVEKGVILPPDIINKKLLKFLLKRLYLISIVILFLS